MPDGPGTSGDEDGAAQPEDGPDDRSATGSPWAGGPVELDKVVPPSGNMQLAGKQFWLGPARSGQIVRFWADTDPIHLLIAGTQVKTVRSHLTITDLARLVTDGAVNAGASPLPPIEEGDAVEIERVVSRGGAVVAP